MGYVEVAAHQTWHEVSGSGDPVVLLHGGFAGADSWFAQQPALVAAGYQVFVPERRGHAHTPDRPGPLTYAAMAEDTAAYLDEIVGRPAPLIGWSDGAVVALLVALQRPDLVSGLVLIGQYYNSSGRVTGGLMDALLADLEGAKSFLRSGYDAVSPDGPAHFDTVFDKLLTMVRTEPEIDLQTLAAVAAPTLVVQGDRDEVSVAHSLDVVAALPDARLAVLPGTHGLPIESPATLNPLILEFLRGGAPAPAWPPSAE